VGAYLDRKEPAMPQATLTVWKFDTPQGAHQALTTLQDLALTNLSTDQENALREVSADS
jgi:hypothetical protein